MVTGTAGVTDVTVTKEHRWFALRAWVGEEFISFEAEWAETGKGAEQYPRFERTARMVAELDAKLQAESTKVQAVREYVTGQLGFSQMDRSVSLTLQHVLQLVGER